MIVKFRTNLDKYQNAFFDNKNLSNVPRKGEYVFINPSLRTYFRDQKLPIKLRVTNVSWDIGDTETKVIIELWYDETDLKAMKLSNVNPF